jgi:hypothetical protein
MPVWFLFDIGILYTYFKYGKRYFPPNLAFWFLPWSILGLFTAFWVEYAFVREFGTSAGGAYAAFLQNLLMSVLFIGMLVRRGSVEGQSLTIAVSKWLGTLAPTIVFGMIRPNPFILVVGMLCSVFDLIYICMVSRYGSVEKPV